jgi:hypothetical protein
MLARFATGEEYDGPLNHAATITRVSVTFPGWFSNIPETTPESRK